MGDCRPGLLALSALLALGAPELSAQSQVISLAALAPGALGISVQSGAIQTIAAVADNTINSFPSPVVILTNWNLHPGQTNTLNVVAYFSSPAQAMVGGATQIPSSRILGRMTTGIPIAFTAINGSGAGSVGTAGAACRCSPSTSMAATRSAPGRTTWICS